MNIISGLFNESEIRVGIVASRFNEVIVSKLIDGAVDGLTRHGVDMDKVDLAWVPGAFEIPLASRKWLNQENMMLSSALAQSSAVKQIIMNMYQPK